jgi:lipid-A-disaccharide synthase-like uncharacterized protein
MENVVLYLPRAIGVVGILLITSGILRKRKCAADEFFLAGGICLLVYSIYIRDALFVVLQIIYSISCAYDLIKNKCKL